MSRICDLQIPAIPSEAIDTAWPESEAESALFLYYERTFFMDRISYFVDDMAPYLMIALPFILIVRFIHYFSKRKYGFQTTFIHELLLILYFLFLVGLASQTIFPDFVNGPDGLKIVESEVQRFNLVPFNKLKEIKNAIMYDNVDYVIIEVFGNIAIFVIIGFLTPLLWKKYEKMKNTVGISFLISLFIETTQIFLPRATDVDDLIMNTLGGLIGYILYLLVKKGIPHFSDRCKAYNRKNQVVGMTEEP